MKRVLFILLLLVPCVLAHQPRVVSEQYTIVEQPEISKAYYGSLEGNSHIFTIRSDEPFELYVNILTTDMKERDVTVTITHDERVLATLGEGGIWRNYREEFAGDDLIQGNEYHSNVSAGTYEITVGRPDNLGPYVLVVGNEEYFPFEEWVSAVFLLPRMKQVLGKNPASAYFNKVGLLLASIALLIIAGVWVMTTRTLLKH